MFVYFYIYYLHQNLNVRTISFPTLRSSHLAPGSDAMLALDPADGSRAGAHDHALGRHLATLEALHAFKQGAAGDAGRGEDAVALGEIVQRIDAVEIVRSEEHTSELQSLMRISYAVFCLKKKKNKNNY